MSNQELMTYGAIGFALFAVSVYLSKKQPGQAIANQPGQQQRDAGLLTWNQTQLRQWDHVLDQAAAEQLAVDDITSETDRLLARYPAPTA